MWRFEFAGDSADPLGRRAGFGRRSGSQSAGARPGAGRRRVRGQSRAGAKFSRLAELWTRTASARLLHGVT